MNTFHFLKNRFFIAGILVSVCLFTSCSSEDPESEPGSPEYNQAVADFYMSIAASQTDQSRFAFNKMNDVAVTFPKEAAAWANLGVYAMRQGNFELAADRMQKARELKPENPDILFLSSLVESRRGDIAESIAFLRRAAEIAPDHPRILFALANELERQDDEGNNDEIQAILRQLEEIIPENEVVLLELIRLSAKDGELSQAHAYLEKLRNLSADWTQENRDQLQLIFEQIEQENESELLFELSILRSGLGSQPKFQDDLLRVQLPPTDVGYLITRFLHLPQPEVNVAEPDVEMQLTREVPDVPVQNARWIKGVTLLEDVPPFPVSIDKNEVIIDDEVRLDFPGSVGKLPPNAFAEIDVNYNFRNDIALAGEEGFRLYLQNEDQTFTDITSKLGLPSEIIEGNYFGVWAFDLEMDGDLDLLLAPSQNHPVVLRNNGDNTFTGLDLFEDHEPVIDFRWADMDGDGVPEAIFLSRSGDLDVFRNLRGGVFDPGETVTSSIAAMTVSDLNADGQFEIISVGNGGTITSFGMDMRNGGWTESELRSSLELQPGEGTLFAADLDNNGAIDLILSNDDQTWIWLGGEDRRPVPYNPGEPLPGGITSVFDIDGDDRLDLLGISKDLEPFQLRNSGTRDYFARSIRARASGTEGDRRINSFGIGGEMEVRSGLLYQKQLISSPIVHFGLGEYEEAQMLRIIWPNGSVQAEFAELGMGATIFNEQILKGSCPWLFANDGEEIQFVTDAIWRSPLGLRINSQETAGVIQTYDRVRVPADMLRETDGVYDLRVTAELWETHFFDLVGLMAIDHPEDTEIFIDERFVFPAPDLSTRLISVPKPVTSVTAETGDDVTATVSAMDRNYFRPFPNKTAYQGLTEEHSFVVELGEEIPDAPIWLTLSGWLRPTDSSINLALSQGSHEAPKGLQVEVTNQNGDWKTLHDDYGIPAGKMKTILLDLEGVFEDNSMRKVRFTTTSEIYWDGIFWGEKIDPDAMNEYELNPVKMDLRYRGFSEWTRADSVSPELPDYGEISSTAQRWRDLEGHYTRFGDVSELLAEIDDRYVIMNAGDELILHFDVPKPPKEGYKRSFVFVSDGWVKDGDYNTEASATVLPLPYHGHADYEYTSSGTLLKDPVFNKHREDWIRYHTRHVTSHVFRNSILLDGE